MGNYEGSGKREFRLNKNWKLQSSEMVTNKGEEISSSSFDDDGWYNASVPSTIMSALVENGKYKDIFYGTNLRKIPGVSYKIGSIFSNQEMDESSPFARSWWYRKEFTIPFATDNDRVLLNFKGINYRANVWVNGQKVSGKNNLVGAFRTFKLDITPFVTPQNTNVLAVEIFPPKAKDLAITWVDWNPSPPDKNMGIWQDVTLILFKGVELHSSTVETLHLDEHERINRADIIVRTYAKNHTDKRIDGKIKAFIEGDDIQVSLEQEIHLNPKEQMEISLPEEDVITVNNPHLWWPHSMGEPYLHSLTLVFEDNNGVFHDIEETKFGISKISSERTANDDLLLKVNGKPLLVKGGGWAPDMLLRKDDKRRKSEFSYVKNLGLNTIRLEGKLEDEDFFNLADAEGILLIAGWCCCDAWEKWKIWDDENILVARDSLRDQLLRLRHHPSMLLWMNGSDSHPPEHIEQMYLDIEKEVHWNTPVTSSAKNLTSKITGFSGVKMNGPYDYVPPIYWYVAKTIGGAQGFNTETGPGPSIPTFEELSLFIPEDKKWPINNTWNYHAGGGPFKTIDLFYNSLEKRYGTPKDLKDFIWKSQASNYEAHRAMFEAYSRERYNSTGIVQWMLNNAWPGIIWHLYSYYLIGAGSYFGAKKALEPLHIQYSYDDLSVVINNSSYKKYKSLVVKAYIFDKDSKENWKHEEKVDISEDEVKKVFKIPEIHEKMYFLKLKLENISGDVISDNFYWLSETVESLLYDETTFYHTPQKDYADFTKMSDMKRAEVSVSETSTISPEGINIRVAVRNTGSTIALLTRIRVIERDKDVDIVPSLFEDNYFSLVPGETKIINVKVNSGNINEDAYRINVDGFNIDKTQVY